MSTGNQDVAEQTLRLEGAGATLNARLTLSSGHGAFGLLRVVIVVFSAPDARQLGCAHQPFDRVLDGLLLVPALAFVWALWSKAHALLPPEHVPLTLTGLGALAISLFCAFTLAGYRNEGGSLT